MFRQDRETYINEHGKFLLNVVEQYSKTKEDIVYVMGGPGKHLVYNEVGEIFNINKNKINKKNENKNEKINIKNDNRNKSWRDVDHCEKMNDTFEDIERENKDINRRVSINNKDNNGVNSENIKMNKNKEMNMRRNNKTINIRNNEENIMTIDLIGKINTINQKLTTIKKSHKPIEQGSKLYNKIIHIIKSLSQPQIECMTTEECASLFCWVRRSEEYIFYRNIWKDFKIRI